jgi:cytochrome oxidase Cu insertion factor (SCO1/SenC/PrrC family)
MQRVPALLAALGLAAVLAPGLSGCDWYEKPGRAFPDLGLRDLDGNAITLSALRGRPWVVEVWLPG